MTPPVLLPKDKTEKKLATLELHIYLKKTIDSTQGGSNSTSHNVTRNTTQSNTIKHEHTIKHNEAMCLMV